MAGNGDEGGGAWIDQVHGRLRGLVDETIDAIAAMPIKADDILGIERRARAITNVARAAKAIEALKARRDKRRAATAEDDMGDDEDQCDAAEMERVQRELESRLDRLRTTIEAKRMDGWTVVPAGAPGGGGDAGPA